MPLTSVHTTWTSSPPRLRPVAVLGTGSGTPPRVLSNADLEGMVDTSDEWIVTRTGIRERRIVDGQATSDLAIDAARNALAAAGVTADRVEMILVATVTPDEACRSRAACRQRSAPIAPLGSTCPRPAPAS